ncbi:MAG: VCBS repeat-containing protein [Opitutae bacterium]|nr:VCBS repeat-containing protein [Opitutae bacterium]
MKSPRFPLGLVLALALSCAAAVVSRAQFVERAASAGLNVNAPTSALGHTDTALDFNSVGGAACACDLDGDGWTDLIVARTGAPCLVFLNNRNGTFGEQAAARGLDGVSDIGGIAAGDLDNDGDTDLVMSPVGGARYFLFLNDGTGHFREAAVERGADVPVTGTGHRGQSVSLVDYDRDGYLDIHFSEWDVPSSSEDASHAALLHNRGRAAPAFFENKTAASGLMQPAVGPTMFSYASAWADFDGNGYPDAFVAGDFGTTQLWWNNGDGTFTNGTQGSGVANGADGMGVTVLDFDGDGRLDVFMTAVMLTARSGGNEMASANLLFRNLGERRFAPVADAGGASLSGWGWGAAALDANNDGWPDLVATNGYSSTLQLVAQFATDSSKFFLNNGGSFTDASLLYHVTDTGLGRSAVIFDYDNDGREDVFFTQTVGSRILYHNEGAASAHWLALKFIGTSSNRDGYGAEVTITAGGRSQIAVYNPTNAYIGQREPRLHFGLGAATTISRVTVKWPSGTVQELTDVTADQLLTVTEAGNGTTPPPSTNAPVITTQPSDVSIGKDASLTLSVAASGAGNVFNWFKDGTRLTGATSATLTLPRTEPVDAGTYTVTVTNPNGSVTSRGAVVTVTANLAAKSVARWWNEALLDGIRKDTPNPPVHARNLYHLSTVLWDTFWAYETDGWARQKEMFTKETVALPAAEADRIAAQREAMSYAAYTFIKARFARSPGVAATTAGIRWLMQQYGYNPDLTDASGTTPSATGIRIAQRILDLNRDDGANEANGYVDATNFAVMNPALLTQTYGIGNGVNPDLWQPLNLANTITQNGIILGNVTQSFVGVNAIATRTFALGRNTNRFLVDDPGPPPQFAASTRAEYIRQAREVLEYSSQLTVADGATIDISPGKLLNNSLGTNDGKGHATNPTTNQPYASNVVLRGDYARVLAEFWADGPQSETPPGHWNVLFNQISDHSAQTFRYRGGNIVLRRLEWDVAGYLALNGALHDAACAAWTLKWEYNSARPLTMIRYLAALGQSSDPAQPGYHADGLPLVPGVIEVVTAQSSAPGERHAHLANSIGKIAVKTWLGTPPSPTMTSGTGWILGGYWMPYQRETFVTPAFPAYISGHSTFSRAGAEVLARFTGSEFFPGGLASATFAKGSLGFEYGPSQDITLQWATYYDAADQAGLSRLFGGIHISADDFVGRRTGSKVGLDAFTKFTTLYAPPTTSASNGNTNNGSGSSGTTTPSTPTTSGSSGGGGGAPSGWFAAAIALLALARARREAKRARPTNGSN